MASNNVTKIQDLAESYIREGGYKAFSFRELAKDVGIKSSSIHYHFPTKEDLARAVARRYTDRFIDALGEVESPIDGAQHNSSSLYIQRYKLLFSKALMEDKQMCLCGALAAESDSLPEQVKEEAARFFKLNLQWLKSAFALDGVSDFEQTLNANMVLSALEGAMMVSKTLQDDAFFESVAKQF